MSQVTRVCLTGPESVGKSLLAERLASHFGTVWSVEFSRQYAEDRGGRLAYADVAAIAMGQVQTEDRAIAVASGLVILDTDVLSSVTYSRYCYGKVAEIVLELAAARRADLYLLLDVDVPYVPDTVRSSLEHRQKLFAEFRSTLETYHARYLIVAGDWESRFKQAVQAIEALVS